ncbi:MAG: hypothetical protein ACXV5Q_12450 [Frankiaceae bacterium]
MSCQRRGVLTPHAFARAEMAVQLAVLRLVAGLVEGSGGLA